MNKLFGFFMVSLLAYQASFSQQIDSTEVKVAEIEVVNKIELDWVATYKDALRKSKKEDKPVLMYFTGSDWCGPCKILDKDLFHTEKFKALADKDLVLLEVDIPRRTDIISADKMNENLYLQRKYKVRAFPTLMMVNHRGKKIAEKKGYVMTEYYYPFFQSVIGKY
ncbi:MAG: thioredoxin family protein [Flavobacteriales bacterium]